MILSEHDDTQFLAADIAEDIMTPGYRFVAPNIVCDLDRDGKGSIKQAWEIERLLEHFEAAQWEPSLEFHRLACIAEMREALNQHDAYWNLQLEAAE